MTINPASPSPSGSTNALKKKKKRNSSSDAESSRAGASAMAAQSAASQNGTSSTDNDLTGAHIDVPRTNVDARILEARKRLPISIAADAIAAAVRENETVVLLGETGSGKTTQIPQYLYEAGLTGEADSAASMPSTPTTAKRRRRRQPQIIGITQPRRVAAISLAKRVAVEMGVPEPGADEARGRVSQDGAARKKLVGYSVRFDDQTSRETRIKFMTDGWLLRELLSGQGTIDDKAKHKRSLNGVARQTSTESKGQEYSEQSHSLLERYSVIVIDEAHERSVHTDVVLGLVKKVQRERRIRRMAWLKQRKAWDDEGASDDEPTDLKVVVMSATIDAEKFAQFFASSPGTPAPILYIKGRQFPIKLYHSCDACPDLSESCKKTLVKINELPPGDVLIFMTGAEEIESLASDLIELSKGLRFLAQSRGDPLPLEFVVVKLYAALGGDAIRKCFAPTPPHSRKIVLATNIAETSITISGIKYVIDCGLVKERTFQNSMAGEQQSSGSGQSLPSQTSSIGASLEMLTITPVSKAAARQRAGRAGRESEGKCYRLYTDKTFQSFEESTQPEILRTDLSSVMLDVFAMGLNPITFDWLDPPDTDSIWAAVLHLTELGAIDPVSKHISNDTTDAVWRLTDRGRQMAKLPVVPTLSQTLLNARDYDSGDEEPRDVFMQALDLVSVLSTERRSLLVEPAGRSGNDGGKDVGSNKKRQEADRARERLAHRTGDHATQLQALAAFKEAQEKYTIPHGGTSKGTKLDAVALKEWCNDNFVSLKAVREAMRIRAQLLQICKRNKWLPDGEDLVNGHSMGKDMGSDAEMDSDVSDDDLLVTRGSRHANAADHAGPSTSMLEQSKKKEYVGLRRCLVQGKRQNTALREGESSYYTRAAHSDQLRFRIHPSSTLMLASGYGSSDQALTPQAAARRLPRAIYFEDVVFTTQYFARSVSVAEAAWLAGGSTGFRRQSQSQ